MKAAWERAASSQERTISDWARRALNEAAGYPPEAKVEAVPGGVKVTVRVCPRLSTHRKGVYCKACGRTP